MYLGIGFINQRLKENGEVNLMNEDQKQKLREVAVNVLFGKFIIKFTNDNRISDEVKEEYLDMVIESQRETDEKIKNGTDIELVKYLIELIEEAGTLVMSGDK